MLDTLKSILLPQEERPIRILAGPLRGTVFFDRPRNVQQTRFGLYERETHPVIRRALRECEWVVDVGAGAGELVCAFARRGAPGPIIAAEPSADAVRRLRLALAANGVAGRVAIEDRFIGGAPDRLPLDALPLPRDRPGFIKIDVDGPEVRVLESGRDLLSEARPLLLVETHSASLEQGCIALLSSLGYRCTVVGQAWWRSIAFRETRPAFNRWLVAEA